MAQHPEADDSHADLPISRLGKDSLDFSFSGLKTALLYQVRGVPRPKREGGGFPDDMPPLTEERRRNLAASFQSAAAKAVELKLERAAERTPEARSLIVGGGVTANSRLRDDLAAFAERRGLRLLIPEPRYCVDNAAMIAGLGYERLVRNDQDDLTLTPIPTTAC